MTTEPTPRYCDKPTLRVILSELDMNLSQSHGSMKYDHNWKGTLTFGNEIHCQNRAFPRSLDLDPVCTFILYPNR